MDLLRGKEIRGMTSDRHGGQRGWIILLVAFLPLAATAIPLFAVSETARGEAVPDVGTAEVEIESAASASPGGAWPVSVVLKSSTADLGGSTFILDYDGSMLSAAAGDVKPVGFEGAEVRASSGSIKVEWVSGGTGAPGHGNKNVVGVLFSVDFHVGGDLAFGTRVYEPTVNAGTRMYAFTGEIPELGTAEGIGNVSWSAIGTQDSVVLTGGGAGGPSQDGRAGEAVGPDNPVFWGLVVLVPVLLAAFAIMGRKTRGTEYHLGE